MADWSPNLRLFHGRDVGSPLAEASSYLAAAGNDRTVVGATTLAEVNLLADPDLITLVDAAGKARIRAFRAGSRLMRGGQGQEEESDDGGDEAIFHLTLLCYML
jgi:hypothetical protein